MVETDEKGSLPRPGTPTDASIHAACTSTSTSRPPSTPDGNRIPPEKYQDDDLSCNQCAPNGRLLQGGETAEKQESSDATGLAEESEDTEYTEDGAAETFGPRANVEDARDVEPGPRPSQSRPTKSARDSNLVDWDGPDDPENPKNWSDKRKWVATFIVSCFTFISPVSSSMVAPALGVIGAEFGITHSVELSLTLSIFVLAYAVGPLLMAPLSEMYGRVYVLQISNLLYLFFNLGCGLAQSKAQMIAFRFLSGLGGSAPLALGGGVISDLFPPEERGRAISIYSLAPLLGPAVGPIAGGFITASTTWRWVFFATCIADVLIQVLGFLFLQETYAPTLIHRKKMRLIRETGNKDLRTAHDHPEHTLFKHFKINLSRPFILLGTQAIVQVLALYMAYLYGIMYLVLSTFPLLWTENYKESVGIGGLNYISLGVGFFLGTQITAPIQDRIYCALKARNNGVGCPEFRVPVMVPGAIIVPVGLFWYGWTAENQSHWILPNIGAAMVTAGIIIGFQSIQTYIVDAYTKYAASAIGAATVLRSLAGFGFPLFAPYMYSTLGYGWGNSLLGFLAVGIGWSAPILLWFFGERLRKRSTFAAG